MRSVKSAAIAALLSCSLMTPAEAAITPTSSPSTSVLPEMETQCAAYLTFLQNGGAGAGRVFTVVAVEHVVYSIEWGATPTSRTEIAGTRAPAAGASVVSYSDVSAAGADPSRIGRNGGSPNLFADDAVARTVVYSNSTYQTLDSYAGTVNYNYHCTPTERVTTTGPAVTRMETQSECVERVRNDEALQATPEFIAYGSDQGNAFGAYCQDHRINITVPGEEATAEAPNYQLSKGYPWAGEGAVTRDITGTDTGMEMNGGQHSFDNQNLRVTAVVCNSPGSKGGTWTPQNGYSGMNCNSTFFSTARQVSGNNFGPYIPSNSLPPTGS